MSTLTTTRTEPLDTVRLSTRFGVLFPLSQLLTMVVMAVFVLPLGGSPGDPALERGRALFEHAGTYRAANFVFMISGVLLLGFLGAVGARLRRADASGVLSTVAVAAGTLLALVWPMAGMLHDVTLETAASGTDLRILAGWDAIAPFSLAFSVLPRIFFVGAVVLALRSTGTSPRLVRAGVATMVVSAVGSATLVAGALFPVLALSTLAFEIWVGALAITWLRERP